MAMKAMRNDSSRAFCLILCLTLFAGLLVDVSEAIPAYPPLIRCDTTGRSPPYTDALAAAQYISNLPEGTLCCNGNCAASICTTMGYDGHGAVGLCTEYKQCQGCMPCSEAGDYLQRTVRQCEQGGLSGGSFQAILDDNDFFIELIIFNTDDM